jgi:hypothetical protein
MLQDAMVGVPRFQHAHQTLLITRDVLVHDLQARTHECAEHEARTNPDIP